MLLTGKKVISSDLSGNNGDGLNFYEQVIAGEALDAKQSARRRMFEIENRGFAYGSRELTYTAFVTAHDEVLDMNNVLS